jgi:hypothetical protein
MNRYLALVTLALLLPATALGAAGSVGGWKRLPAAPISPEFSARVSVWTGKQMLVFGRDQQTALDKNGNPYATGSVNVAAAYDPRSNSWRKLSPPAKTSAFGGLSAVWTGTEMLVWGQGTRLAYDPAADKWRQLPGSPLFRVHDGFGAVVWTGKEMLGWGGGCCGDSFSDGVAYNPATNAWRALPKAPLPGNQHPLGGWTGKEYIVLSGTRAAAYSSARNTWRRLARAPVAGTLALWRADALDVVAADGHAAEYDPVKNRWHALPSLPPGRVGKVIVSEGVRLFVWGGARGGAFLLPGAKRWTPFARGPLPPRLEPTAVWTGGSMIVWGGAPTKTWGKYVQDGAVYSPPVLQACGDGWMAENLRVTEPVKRALRVAYRASHPPLAGHTYYGMYSGTSYAVATFGRAPTIFRTDGRGMWHVRAETAGRICKTVVPVELLKAWSLRPAGGGCYVEPR